MAFSEPVKLSVKRRAHFHCSLCHSLGVEIHHIVPQWEGGSDEEENAAPLCPSCHETYGANPEKRKFIREARDFWYEVCAKRYSGDSADIERLGALLGDKATKDDVRTAVDKLTSMLAEIKQQVSSSPDQARISASQLAGTLTSTPFGGVSAGRHCRACGLRIGLLVGDSGRCPKCGTPW